MIVLADQPMSLADDSLGPVAPDGAPELSARNDPESGMARVVRKADQDNIRGRERSPVPVDTGEVTGFAQPDVVR